MRVLVIGSGAREHALVARLAADRDVGEHRLRARESRNRAPRPHRVRSTSPTPMRSLALADREQIDLTVVGPELPLSLGVADRFAAAGRLLFGPTAAAARLESSKAFAKAFMARHGVPTARFRTCESLDEALRCRFARGEFGLPVVLKADGLAAGKGVVIAEDLAERRARDRRRDARSTVRRGRRHGSSSKSACTGPRCRSSSSATASRACRSARRRITSGSSTTTAGRTPAGWARSRRARWCDAALDARVMREIVEPVIAGMAERRSSVPRVSLRRPDADGGGAEGDRVQRAPRRSRSAGDPAAASTSRCCRFSSRRRPGRLTQSSCASARDCVVGVVLASRGYPESSESGQPIDGIERGRSDARRVGVSRGHGACATDSS